MQKKFLRLLDLGQNTFWQLLQNVTDANEEHLQTLRAEIQKTPLHLWVGPKNAQDKQAFLQLLQEQGLPYTEHDCTHMDSEALEAAAQAYDGANTLNITCGFNETQLLILTRQAQGAWFNGLAECACPWAGLAEAAFTVSLTQNLDSWRICWLGGVSPVAQSLMEAAIYTPYELFMGIPTWSDPDHSSTDMALKAGAKIFMTREPRLALDEAHIIYMDESLEAMTTAKTPAKPIPIYPVSDNFIWEKGLALTEANLAYALPEVHIVATDPKAKYAKAEADLQAQRMFLHRAALLITLHHTLQES